MKTPAMPAYHPVDAAPAAEIPSHASSGVIRGMQQGTQASTTPVTPAAAPIFWSDNFMEAPFKTRQNKRSSQCTISSNLRCKHFLKGGHDFP
jgi:hypothetical protein